MLRLDFDRRPACYILSIWSYLQDERREGGSGR